jgi:predicted ribosomally synthesized peptide with nif11-like leader
MKRSDAVSSVIAKKLVKRLKDDETFRKSIRALNYEQAWDLVRGEGYACTEEEIKDAYDTFG